MANAFRERYGAWALIAGASEGLGAEFAEQLARRGLGLVLVARRVEPLTALATRLREQYGTDVRTIVHDLSDEAQLRQLAIETDDLEIGLLICNAALAPIGAYLERSADEHAKLIDLNCRATALLAHHFGRRMVTRRRGGIVVMTSLASLQGTAMTVHYAASKAYLRVLAEGLWEELRPSNVHVVACMAGPTSTPTWNASEAKRRFGIPPVQSAREVVDAALGGLGRGPVCVPGGMNRVTEFLMKRVLPISAAVRLVSDTTRKMYTR